MPNQSRQDFKSPLKKLLGRYYGFAGIIVFLLGVLLRLAALGKTGFFGDATKDIGTFLAVAVAIPFLYEKLIKSEERQLFLTELEELLDSKFTNYKIGLKLYEAGRFEIYISDSFPYMSATCIDVNEVNGRMLISPYLYGIKRAEVPHFDIFKTEHEVMF